MRPSYAISPTAHLASAFGSGVKERSITFSIKYVFSFNGKENEINYGAEAISFEYRLFDSRNCRYSSGDPDESRYSWQSTYSYFYSSPILFIDYLGKGESPKKDAPDWYSDDSRRNRREIRRFKRHLDKKEVIEMNRLEEMPGSVAKTDAVNNFVRTINEKYRDKKWFYRKHKDTREHGQFIFYSMSSIWAYKADPKPTSRVPNNQPGSMPITWPTSFNPGDPRLWFTNNSGMNAQVQVTIVGVTGSPFQQTMVSIDIIDPAGNPLPGLTNDLASTPDYNSQVFNVPAGGRVSFPTSPIAPRPENRAIISLNQIFLQGNPGFTVRTRDRFIQSVGAGPVSIREFAASQK